MDMKSGPADEGAGISGHMADSEGIVSESVKSGSGAGAEADGKEVGLWEDEGERWTLDLRIPLRKENSPNNFFLCFFWAISTAR